MVDFSPDSTIVYSLSLTRRFLSFAWNTTSSRMKNGLLSKVGWNGWRSLLQNSRRHRRLVSCVEQTFSTSVMRVMSFTMG